MRPYRRIILLCLLVTLLCSTTAQAAEKLRVAIDKAYVPMTLLTPGHEPAGILVEMWELWSRQTGIEVEFVEGNWEETLEMVRSGQADVHSGLFKNKRRAQWLAFSDKLHSINSTLFHRTHSEPPCFDRLAETKVGVVAGTYQQDYLKNNYPETVLRTYVDHESLLTGLIAGEVDAIFEEVPTVARDLARLGWQGLVSRAPGCEISNTVHAAVLKTRTDLIKLIDNGFQKLDPIVLAAIDKRWIVNPADRFHLDPIGNLAANLTDEEKGYLLKHPTLSLTSTPNWPPFEMEMEDGSYSGIAADFIRLAASKVGFKIRPSFDTDWGAHMDKLAKGTLDVAPGLNETPKRLERFIFTKPYIEYYSAIFTTTDRKDIGTPEDLAGKTVALEDGYAIARSLPTDHPQINLMLVKTTQDALEAVSTGKADAYIGNQVVASYLIKKFTLPNLKLVSLWRTDLPGQLRFAVSKDNPTLRDILQKGLEAITKQERQAILSSYLDASGFQQKVFSLTNEEWAWLKAHPRIKIGVNPGMAPLEFFDDQGEYQGISSEYIAFLKDKLKTEIIPSEALGRNEVLEYAEQGRLDVISAAARTPNLEKRFNFTSPYIEFPVVIFSSREAPLISSLTDTANGRIAVVQGSVAHENLSTDHPDMRLVLFSSVDDAVEALALGKVDWLVNDLATGSYSIEQKGITTLKVAASTKYIMSLGLAVRKDYPELVQILNKALAVVSDEQAAKFKGKWLALKFEHGLEMKTVLTWVLPSATGVLLVIGLIVLWNRKLGSEIAERKAAEQALSVSEVKYRGLVENANSVILKLDVQGRIIFFNEFAQSFFGYSAEEIEGQPIVGTIVADGGGDEQQNVAAYIQELIKHPDRHQTNENENVRKNGERVWISWNNQAIFDEQGQFVELLCVGVDVTERRKAQAELAATVSALDEKNQMLEGLSSKLAKYLSPQVYNSIFSGDRDVALTTERKKLTVFFSDIKDFTKTTDDMQPEDLTSLLNSYFTEMSAIALEYGATIDKFIGDAMLMFFGDPETKGVTEDARLCVRMAVAMQKRMAELEKEWQKMGYDKPFKMRVGVNTGYCNVGNFGSETRMDYTIIGGEVNLAARLEGQADPGGVLLSSETYALVQDIVHAEERDPLSVKGIRRSIRPYAVLSLCDDEGSHTQLDHTIQYRTEGVEVSVELDRLTPEKRKALSLRLNEIARQLDAE